MPMANDVWAAVGPPIRQVETIAASPCFLIRQTVAKACPLSSVWNLRRNGKDGAGVERQVGRCADRCREPPEVVENGPAGFGR